MFYGIATHDVSFIFAHFPCRNDVIKRKLTSNFRDNSVASYADRHSLGSSCNFVGGGRLGRI